MIYGTCRECGRKNVPVSDIGGLCMNCMGKRTSAPPSPYFPKPKEVKP